MIRDENLPKRWNFVNISDIADVKGGKRLPKGNSLLDSKTPYPYIRVLDFKNRSIMIDSLKFLSKDTFQKIKNYRISSEDVYLSIAGTIGLAGTIPFELDGANLTENAVKLCKLKDVDKYFLAYLLDSTIVKSQIEALTMQANQPKLALFRIKKLKIPLPPIYTQKKIVEILERAEKLKEWRLEADTMTDKYLKSVFNHLFLKERFKEEILSDFTELISSGSTPKGGRDVYLDEGDIMFIRSQNVLMNKFSEHDALYLPFEIHERMKRTWVKNKDVLLNITGASIGRTTIYEGEDYKANVNQHVCIIRLKDFNHINPVYLTYFLSSPPMQKHIWKINAGATRQALNFSQISKFKIPIPPLSLQNQFSEIVQKIKALKTHQKESKLQIDNLFNALMQKAFKGELVC